MANWKAIGISTTLVAVGSLIAVIVLAVVVGNSRNEIKMLNENITNTPAVCTTKACINAANMILKNINATADPCEDFNLFACGNFLSNNRIPDDRTSLDTFGDLRNTLSFRLSDQLEQPIDPKNKSATENAKRYYNSCINESIIESDGERNFLEVLNNELDGWPILSGKEYTPSKTAIEKITDFLKKGLRPLFSIVVTSNPKMPAQYVIAIEQPSWFFSKSYYDNQNIMAAYKKYMKTVAEYMGANVNANYQKEIDDMFALETDIVKLLLTEEEKRNLTYDQYTIAEMDEKLPQVQWKSIIIDGIYKDSGVEVKEDEKLVVYDWKYLSEAANLLKDAALNRRKALDNLMVWGFIRDRASYLPKKYRDARLEFDKLYTGQQVIPPRSTTCSNAAADRMPYAVGQLYVSKYFDEGSKKQAAEMIENIRVSFKQLLKGVEWMDGESKKKAEEKADAIDVKIGYPEFTYNNTYLDMLYEDYVFDETNYIQNNFKIIKSDAMKNYKKLRETRNLKDWFSGPAIVNAFYEPELNQICFPAGILQAPFYDAQTPRYLNYGGIGVVIGHEITHGFDDQGRLYDKDGVFFPDGEPGLWSDSTIAKYKEKAQCIIDQYSSYVAKQVGLNVNGAQTQGENIADNGGIRESYLAYKEWEKKNGKEPLLPGLNYNQDQLFFINHGQVWCSKFKDATLIQRIKTGVHSPGEFRIRGPTSNHDAFAKAFNCKPKQGNNPENKCIVW